MTGFPQPHAEGGESWFAGSLQRSPPFPHPSPPFQQRNLSCSEREPSLPGLRGKHLQRRLRAGSVRFHCVSGSGLGRSQGREGRWGAPCVEERNPPPRPPSKILSSKRFSLELKNPQLGLGNRANPSSCCCCPPANLAARPASQLQGRSLVATRSGHQGAALSRLLCKLPEIPCISHHREIPFDAMPLQPSAVCALRVFGAGTLPAFLSFPSLQPPAPKQVAGFAVYLPNK